MQGSKCFLFLAILFDSLHSLCQCIALQRYKTIILIAVSPKAVLKFKSDFCVNSDAQHNIQ